MARIDNYYNQLLSQIKEYGFKYTDESRDVVCQQINACGIQIDTAEFPLLTVKKMYWKGIVGELLWFLKGDDNIKYLLDNDIHIWDKDAYNHYLKNTSDALPILLLEDFIMMVENTSIEVLKESSLPNGYVMGDVGRNYGVQWRKWTSVDLKDELRNTEEFDQIDNLIKGIAKKPIGRRHIVTAWNPAELGETALPACHWAWEILPRPLFAHERQEFYENANDATLAEDAEAADIHKVCDEAGIPAFCFDLKWHQRSVDTFLGLPFNIASYALLGNILSMFTGMIFRTLIADLSCVHIYENHLDAVNECLTRDSNKYPAPILGFSAKVQELSKEWQEGKYINIGEVLDQLEIEDFQLVNYESYEPIKAEMLAPKTEKA